MLTIKFIKNTPNDNLKDIYKYYFSDGEESSWYGAALDEELSCNSVSLVDFENVFLGKKFGVKLREDTFKFLDLAFSAPKSVSIIAALDSDLSKVTKKAHDTAVKKTLERIQDNYTIVRKTKEGQRIRFLSKRMACAISQQIDSRNLEPSLHSHCLISKIALLNGEPLTMKFNPLLKDVKSLGLFYRGFLADELKKEGFSLRNKGDGFFELAQISDDLISALSSRRKDIIEYQSKSKVILNPSKLNSLAAEFSRKKKQVAKGKISIVSNNTKEVVNSLNMDNVLTEENLLACESNSSLNIDKMESEAILYLEKCVSNHNACTYEKALDLLKTKMLVHNVSEPYLKSLLGRANAEKKVFWSDGLFYARDPIDTKSQIKNLINQTDQKKISKIMFFDVDKKFAFDEKKSALAQLLAAKEQFLFVSSKNWHDLNYFRNLAGSRSLFATVTHIFPTEHAAKLNDKYHDDVNSYSIDAFKKLPKKNKNPFDIFSKLWIVSGTDKVSADDVIHILDKAKAQEARVVFLGNKDSKNWDLGLNTFNFLPENSKVHNLSPYTSKLLKNLENTSGEELMSSMKESGKIKQISSYEDKANECIRHNLQAICTHPKTRELLNCAFRKALGVHDARSFNFSKLEPIFLHKEEKIIENLSPGLILMDQENPKKLHSIASINVNSKQFETSCFGKKHTFKEKDLERFNFFHANFISFRKGEHLIWAGPATKTSFFLGKRLNPGDKFQIAAINNESITLINEKNKKFKLQNSIENGFFDYGYVLKSSHLVDENKKKAYIAGPQKDIYYLRETLLSIAEEENSMLICGCIKSLVNQLDKTESIVKKKLFSDEKVDDTSHLASLILESCKQQGVIADKIVEKYIKAGVSMQHFSINDISKEINKLLDANILTLKNKEYVINEQFKMENDIIEIFKSGIGSGSKICSSEKDINLKNNICTKDQTEAIQKLLLSKDKISLVQGVAGAGKTTLLKQFKEVANQKNYQILAIANTHSARINLFEKMSLDEKTNFSDSLAGFLAKCEANITAQRAQFCKKPIIIVDESSMIGLKDLYNTLRFSKALNAKLILIGDPMQLPSIGASRGFDILLSQSKNTISLGKTMRLKKHESLELIQGLYGLRLQENNQQTLTKLKNALNNKTKEIPNEAKRLEQIAIEYLKIPKSERMDTIVMFATNKERIMFNDGLRQHLIQSGYIDSKQHNVSLLRPLASSKPVIEQKELAPGRKILINYEDKLSGLKKNEWYDIVSTNSDSTLISDKNGSKTTIKTSKLCMKGDKTRIFEVEKTPLAINEIIMFRYNDLDNGIINTEQATIKKIDRNHITVLLKNGQEKTLDLKKNENLIFEYGYSKTIFASQGLDAKHTLAGLTGKNTTLNTLIVAATRGDNLKIFVDNLDKMLISVESSAHQTKNTAMHFLASSDAKKIEKNIDIFCSLVKDEASKAMQRSKQNIHSATTLKSFNLSKEDIY